MTIRHNKTLIERVKQVYLSKTHQTSVANIPSYCVYVPIIKSKSFLKFTICLGAVLTWNACTDDIVTPINLDGLSVIEDPDQNTVSNQIIDMAVRDMRVQDQMLAVDQMLDMAELDMEVINAPDGELPLEGNRCDPRLRAVACDPGFTCLPIPGGRIHQGRCVEGDGCSLVGENSCPDTEPYCHLRGGSTECTQASQRMRGESCLDEFNRALPCAEGLVCNYSVCVPPCDPSLSADEQCGINRQCINISETLDQNAGLCGAIGACNLFNNEGCDATQQCTFAVRPDDQELVYFCTEGGQVSEGEACQLDGSGPNGCSVGLICIGSVEGNPTCKRVCDTGAYQAPCPDGSSCREILSQGGGYFVRGIGLCVINP